MPNLGSTTIRRVVFAALCAVVLIGVLIRGRAMLVYTTAEMTTSRVVHGDDRGPGSFREALFIADSARGHAEILIDAAKIEVKTPLPPLVNSHGIVIKAAAGTPQIDAKQLTGAPVLDVDGAHSSIIGLSIENCATSAILIRAAHVRVTTTTLTSCAVGVDVAQNATDVSIDSDRFVNDGIGIRFAAANDGERVIADHFSGSTVAGLWAVRGSPDTGSGSGIVLRKNDFHRDRIGVVAGNVAITIESNLFADSQESALDLIGSGSVVRHNQINGGPAMGIVADHAHGVQIFANEFDRLGAYAIMVRDSSASVIQSNRIVSGAYGMAFVLGDTGSPNVAAANLIVDQKYDGIDLVGASPVLRANRIVQVGGQALHVADFQGPRGTPVISHPFLVANEITGGPGALGDPAASAGHPATVRK